MSQELLAQFEKINEFEAYLRHEIEEIHKSLTSLFMQLDFINRSLPPQQCVSQWQLKSTSHSTAQANITQQMNANCTPNNQNCQIQEMKP